MKKTDLRSHPWKMLRFRNEGKTPAVASSLIHVLMDEAYLKRSKCCEGGPATQRNMPNEKTTAHIGFSRF